MHDPPRPLTDHLEELRRRIFWVLAAWAACAGFAGIRAVVEHPFAWMKNAGYRRVRYRGLGRNGMDFALHAIAYNFKRSFSIQQVMA